MKSVAVSAERSVHGRRRRQCWLQTSGLDLVLAARRRLGGHGRAQQLDLGLGLLLERLELVVRLLVRCLHDGPSAQAMAAPSLRRHVPHPVGTPPHTEAPVPIPVQRPSLLSPATKPCQPTTAQPRQCLQALDELIVRLLLLVERRLELLELLGELRLRKLEQRLDLRLLLL